MTVALLMAGTIFTCRPWAANSPSCSAMYTPAESAAGTAATVRSRFYKLDGDADPRALVQPAARRPTATVALNTRKGRLSMASAPTNSTCTQGRSLAVPSCPAPGHQVLEFCIFEPCDQLRRCVSP